MYLLILLLLFCLSLEYKQLYQNNSTTIYGSDNFYLSLDGFKSGDKVYIEISYDSYFYYSPTIQYKQSNYSSDNEFNSNSFSNMSSETITTTNSKKTHNYSIKLNANYKYLLFKFAGVLLRLI